jgi:hypothetical protein
MRVSCAFGATTLVALSIAALAQTSGPSGWRNSALKYDLPMVGVPPRVVGAPYSGQLVFEGVTVDPDGTKRVTPPSYRTVFRDSQGRTREEYTLRMTSVPGGQVRDSATVVYICDLVGGYGYLLDTQRSVAHRMKLPKSGTSGRPVPSGAALSAADPREKLGMRVVEGEAADGLRLTSRSGEIDEWTIPDLRVRALRVTRLAGFGHETTERLTNLSRSEPDPALFEVPQGYTVVDESATFLVDLAPLP